MKDFIDTNRSGKAKPSGNLLGYVPAPVLSKGMLLYNVTFNTRTGPYGVGNADNRTSFLGIRCGLSRRVEETERVGAGQRLWASLGSDIITCI